MNAINSTMSGSETHTDSQLVTIDIIVSAYSFERYNDLIDVINGIEQQTYKNKKAIIVIDESKKLYTKVNEYILSNNLHAFQLVFNSENKGLSYSRNIGISHATGDIIAFIDDDAIPYPEWAEAIVNTFKDDEVGAVTGDVVPLWEYEEMSWFPKELHWMISCSYTMTPNKKEEIERGFGTNMAFKRDMLYKVGMFDTNLGIKINRWVGGEDTDMFLRIREEGKKILFNPNARVLHKIYSHRICRKNIIKRAFNGGVSVAVMTKVRQYNIKNSTENIYLKRLLFEFYPKTLKEFLKNPSLIPLKQMIVVGAVMIFELMGYLHGHVRQKEYLMKNSSSS